MAYESPDELPFTRLSETDESSDLDLDCCYHVKFQTCYGLAALFYFLPSLGYVGFDICTFGVPSFGSVPSNAFTVCLASLLLMDSILFMIGFYLYDRPLFVFWSVEMWGDIFNVAGAVFFLISQTLYYLTADDFGTTTEIGWFWAAWYFLAYFTWAISSVLYFQTYVNERRRGRYPKTVPMYCQLAFWDELFNSLASFGYIGTSLYGLIPLSAYITSAAGTDDPVAYYTALQSENFKNQARANVTLDFFWTLGGLVNLLAWWKDGTNHFLVEHLCRPMYSKLGNEV